MFALVDKSTFKAKENSNFELTLQEIKENKDYVSLHQII